MGRIADGEAVLKFGLDPTDKDVLAELVKRHNYPKNSRAAEHNIFIIKTHKLL